MSLYIPAGNRPTKMDILVIIQSVVWSCVMLNLKPDCDSLSPLALFLGCSNNTFLSGCRFSFFRTDLKGLLWASIEFVDYFVCVLLHFCIYIYFHQLPGQVLFFSFYFLLDCSIWVIQSDFFDDTCSFFSSYCLEQSSLPPPPPSILLFPFPSGTSLSLCFY